MRTALAVLQSQRWWCVLAALAFFGTNVLLVAVILSSSQVQPSVSDPSAAKQLFDAWQTQYLLHTRRIPHNATIADWPGVPQAPHLVDCAAQWAEQKLWDEYGPGLEEPEWARAEPPQPPWIVGSEGDSLAGTREMQTRLWRLQFPPVCSRAVPTWQQAQAAAPGSSLRPPTRYLVTAWPNKDYYGLGTQLNVLSGALYAALSSRRVLVFSPHSFHRARHGGCQEFGEYGDLSCYFQAISSRECREAAWVGRGKHAYAESFTFRRAEGLPAAIQRIRSSNQSVQVLNWFHIDYDIQFPPEWGTPWLASSEVEEFVNGSALVFTEKHRKARWWKSQALRFLLRWPSPYLCHLLNCHRHEVYGLHTADLVLRSQREAGEAGEEGRGGAWRTGGGEEGSGDTASVVRGEGATGPPTRPGAQAPSADRGRSLEAREGREEGGSVAAQGTQGQQRNQWTAYLPRPILSVHVRQGDKGKEMVILGFPEYMRAAEELRQRTTALSPTSLPRWLARWLPEERPPSAACLLQGPASGDSKCQPGLSSIWLTTEMQPVVDAAPRYWQWSILFTRNPRQRGEERMAVLDRLGGVEVQTGICFVNLWISSSCDFLLGTLQSGWSTSVDLYRLTAGRSRAPSLTFNFREL